MPGPYTLGDTVVLEVFLSDPDTGAPLDAVDVACKVHPPSGSDGNPSVTKVAAGHYRATYASTVAGEHWYAFSSSTLAMRKESSFVVSPAQVP